MQVRPREALMGDWALGLGGTSCNGECAWRSPFGF